MVARTKVGFAVRASSILLVLIGSLPLGRFGKSLVFCAINYPLAGMNSPWAVVVLALLLIRNYSTYAQQYIFDENFSPAVEGQLDNTGGVLAVSIQEDNKILIGGSFSSVQGEPRNGMARLNADGSIDPDFNPGGGFDGAVRVIVLQPAGKILVGGDFKNVDGSPFTCIVRLLGNGQG
jgi:hypothetical protein